MAYLAIVAYRCLVSGRLTDSLDIQVRWFEMQDSEAVRRFIDSETAQRYNNSEGEEVTWELSQILAVEEFRQIKSGDEVIGFITSSSELQHLANPNMTG